MSIDMRRWWYRRMAWKNDPGLFMEMHPRVSRLIDRLYEPSWPIRSWLSDMHRAAASTEKEQALRDVYGNRETEVKYWKYDDDATTIYREAREQGWTGKRNSVKPYTRRELITRDLGWLGVPEWDCEGIPTEELWKMLDAKREELQREREQQKAQARQ